MWDLSGGYWPGAEVVERCSDSIGGAHASRQMAALKAGRAAALLGARSNQHHEYVACLPRCASLARLPSAIFLCFFFVCFLFFFVIYFCLL